MKLFRRTILMKLENEKFDISVIKFVRPYHLVMLACLIEELKRKTIDSIIIENPTTTDYLKTLKIHNYWSQDFKRDQFTEVANLTTLCLWHISRPMMDQYMIYAKNYYQRSFFKDKDLTGFTSNLAEVFNNIFDHSESKIQGYILTQFYTKENEIVISVCDFGLGIPNKVNSFLKESGKSILNDDKAIEWALQDNFTTKSTLNNRGVGLANIVRNVKSMKGSLKIISNYAFYRLTCRRNKIEEKTFLLQVPIQGTLIIISLDTTQFENIEEEQSEVFVF